MSLTIHLMPQIEAQLQQEAQANGLTLSDQVQTLLTERYAPQESAKSARRWRDICGAAAPAPDRNAQEWVSQTRDADDAARSANAGRSK